MKLYTEEQVIEMIEKSRQTGLTAEYLILTTTPIELPSDEEVNEYLNTFPYTKHLDDGQYNDGQAYGFECGARWAYEKLSSGTIN